MLFFLFQNVARRVIRGSALSNLIGLSHEKKLARTYIKACLNGDVVFPHTLISAIGGTGKTALARAIGQDLGYHFVELHAASFANRSQLYVALRKALSEAKDKGVPLLLFLDEIHRLTVNIQEALYTVMAEWWIPTKDGQDRIDEFTLIGATTRYDMLDANSFVTRFQNKWQIKRYSLTDIQEIVTLELVKVSHRLKVPAFRIGRRVTRSIAQRCLGIPRNAVSLVDKIALIALANGSRKITQDLCELTFNLEQIDALGLTPAHHEYLRKLYESRVNGEFVPMGIGAISGKLRNPQDLVIGSIEPILLELDFVMSTPRGRVLTKKGSNFLENNS